MHRNRKCVALLLSLLALGCGGGPGSGPDTDSDALDPAAPARWSRGVTRATWGSTSEELLDTAEDGAVFVTGVFKGTVDLGTGPLSAPESVRAGYLVALSPQGETRWARAFLGDDAARDMVLPLGVAADTAGGVWLTGSFTGTVDLGNGPVTADSSGAVAFLAHWSASGELLLLKHFVANTNVQPSGIDTLPDGGVVLTGTFQDASSSPRVDFGGGTLYGFPATFPNAFLARFDANGAHVFSKSFPGQAADDAIWQSPRGVRADAQGNILLWGAYLGTMDLGAGPLPAPERVNGAIGTFVARFDSSGAHQFSHGYSRLDALEGDQAPDGRSALCAVTTAATSLGGVELLSDTRFCARYDATGTLTAVHPLTRQALFINDIHLDADGMLWTAGSYDMPGFPDVPLDLGVIQLKGAEGGGHDVVLLRFDGDGKLVQARLAGDQSSQKATAVARTPAGVVILGRFSGRLDFGQGALVQEWPSEGLFLAEYAR